MDVLLDRDRLRDARDTLRSAETAFKNAPSINVRKGLSSIIQGWDEWEAEKLGGPQQVGWKPHPVGVDPGAQRHDRRSVG